MKFPKKLSKERLSLLSPEDRKIYEYEHSGLCPEMKKLQESRKKIVKNDKGEIVPDTCTKCGGNIVLQIHGEPVYICSKCGKYYGTMPFTLHESEESDEEELTFEEVRDFELDNEYTEEEKREIKRIFDEMLFESQFDELYDKELIEEVGLEEYNNIKKQIFEYIMNDPELNALNEAEGHAADWWVDCSWIVKLSAGLLTGLLGIIAWLIMKGKDRLAMAKLKQYMNKLVELTDQGINKKRPWYSFLMPSRKNKQNTGDYNKACFRTIQETAERNMAGLYAQTIHNLGFLSPSITNFRGIHSGYSVSEDSGLGMFNNFINDFTTSFTDDTNISQYAEGLKKLLPAQIETDTTRFLHNIELPDMPTNFNMLLCKIDYPTKANENPNGSLYMDPAKEILDAQGSDLGLRYFNNMDITKVIHTSKVVGESYEKLISNRNSTLSALLEVEDEDGYDKTKASGDLNLLTPDIDPTKVAGKELEQNTEKREKTKIEDNGDPRNPIDSIDNYVTNSLSIITDLMRSICGKSQSTEIRQLKGTINKLNHAAEGNLGDWIKEKEEVLHSIVSNRAAKDQKMYEDHLRSSRQLYDVVMAYKSGKYQISPEKMDKLEEFAENFMQDGYRKQSEITEWFDSQLGVDFSKRYTEVYNAKEKARKQKAGISSSVSYIYNDYVLSLNEDEQFKNKEELLEELQKKCDGLREGITAMIKDKMGEILENNPEDWYIIENTRTRMKALKDAADKEISEKIGLICRTASSANSDLGDKFKAALSKHPVRAESLKNIWARYADDLNDRMETRIRSITHSQGNSSIYVTIRQFLENTYPNLIGALLYYKQIFYLLEKYTAISPIQLSTAEQIEKQIIEEDNEYIKYQLSILLLNDTLAQNSNQ